jgi:hypothetical protein
MSRGDIRWHNGSAIAMGHSGNSTMDGGVAAQSQWAMVAATMGVTVGDGDSGGTILMGINGGGAMDGRMAATVQWQLP